MIRSARRMTYTQVQAILDGDKAARAEFRELAPEFDRMFELALKLNASGNGADRSTSIYRSR